MVGLVVQIWEWKDGVCLGTGSAVAVVAGSHKRARDMFRDCSPGPRKSRMPGTEYLVVASKGLEVVTPLFGLMELGFWF